MPIIKIYDRPMDTILGITGNEETDKPLIDFAGALNLIKYEGFEVERYNLKLHPEEFDSNEAVQKVIAERGNDVLPLIYLDDELKFFSIYPNLSQLYVKMGLKDPMAGTENATCSSNGCSDCSCG